MGLWCDHLHLKGTSQETVVQAYAELLPDHFAFITPCINGWVSVFDGTIMGSSYFLEEDFGPAICRYCHCPGIILKVLASDVLCYWIFDEGGQIDDVADCSDKYGYEELTDNETKGLSGHPERLLRFAQSGVTTADIRNALAKDHLLRADNLLELADLLGIAHVCFRYEDLIDPAWGDVFQRPEWQGTRHIGPGMPS
jgi:hypothetical protein